MARVDGAPASFVLDMAAGPHAPLASHPVRLQVRVEMLVEREDGLRDPEEVDALGALEDAVAERLAAAFDSVYVGRFVARGYTTLVFYLPPPSASFDDELPAALGDLGDYDAEWLTEDDPKWSFYLEFLYPDPSSIQRMANRRVLAALEEHGDDPTAPRTLDHVANFATRQQALDAAGALRAAGFTTSDVADGGPDDAEDRFRLEFRRADALAGGRADEVTFESLASLDPFDGSYDGWGALVVKRADR